MSGSLFVFCHSAAIVIMAAASPVFAAECASAVGESQTTTVGGVRTSTIGNSGQGAATISLQGGTALTGGGSNNADINIGVGELQECTISKGTLVLPPVGLTTESSESSPPSTPRR
jgi:hypothetical protein